MNSDSFKAGVIAGSCIVIIVAFCAICSIATQHKENNTHYENINHIREQILKKKYPGYIPIDIDRLKNQKINA